MTFTIAATDAKQRPGFQITEFPHRPRLPALENPRLQRFLEFSVLLCAARRRTEKSGRQNWFGCSLYGPKFTVTVLEHVWVPASQTLYMKLAWPVVPVESLYEPSFAVVAITFPSR